MSAKKVAGLLLALLFLHTGVSRAMTLAVCRVDESERSARIWKNIKRVVTDPATGLAIHVEQTAARQMIVDVSDKTIAIHKELRGTTSVTTLSSGRNRLVISSDGRDLIVSGTSGTTRGSLSKTGALSPVFEALRKSSLARTAKELLDRLALQADSAEGNTLLLTRALLGSVVGETSSVVQYQSWARLSVTQPRVIKAGMTPGECWDEYSREAIRIWNDYADCDGSCRWYQPFCPAECEGIYILRAEMAFMWYFNCNGPFYAS